MKYFLIGKILFKSDCRTQGFLLPEEQEYRVGIIGLLTPKSMPSVMALGHDEALNECSR
jgi:hypothetical protein